MTPARRFWLVVLVVVAVNQLVSVYMPGIDGPELFDHSDKAAHLLLFAAPAFVAVVADLWPRTVLLLLMAHAAVSEVVQGLLIPGRHGDVRDVVADLVGVAVGWAAGVFVRRWRSAER